MSIPTREEFPAKVIALVTARFPLVRIRPVNERFSLVVNGHVASLENIYRMASLRPNDMETHVKRWIVELLRAAEGNLDQAGTFEELKDRIYPIILPCDAHEASADIVIAQPFVDGLMISYAIDSDRTISYISREHFERWNISIDLLHDTAMANLIERSEAISAHAAQDESGRVNLVLFQQMDGYDASRILLPTLHARLREYLGSPFAAAMPNRDILLCFRADPENVRRLRSQISDDFRSMPHQITDRLFLVTPDGIAPHVRE
jgi:uncharacterized protein YtpQ (UPF0354 family)